MLKRLLAPLQRLLLAAPVDPNAPVILRSAVIDIIDAAFLSLRPARNDDAPRVLVAMPGLSPWLHSDDGAQRAFARLFPELSERQIAKAVQRLSFRVAAVLRDQPGSTAVISGKCGGPPRSRLWDEDLRIGAP